MKTIAMGVAVLIAIICATFACFAQEKLRRVEQPAKFVYKNTPIQVVVKMDGEPLPSRKILAGPDWLQRISLEVTNLSRKDINGILINLLLREPPYGRKATLETVGIEINFELQHSEPKIKVLLAGDRATLKPPVSVVDKWTEFALKHGMEDIESVILDIRQVRFTDDTGWSLGSQTRRDPETGRQLFVAEQR